MDYKQMDLSEYIYGIPLEQADYMMNDSHEIQYNEMCMECQRECKQSYKCTIVECPRFLRLRKGRGRKAAE